MLQSETRTGCYHGSVGIVQALYAPRSVERAFCEATGNRYVGRETIMVGEIMAKQKTRSQHADRKQDRFTYPRRIVIRNLLESIPSSYDEIMEHVANEQHTADKRTIMRDVAILKAEHAAHWRETTAKDGRGRQKRFSIAKPSSSPLATFIINQAIEQLKHLDTETARDAVDLLAQAVPAKYRELNFNTSELPYLRIGEYDGQGFDVDVLRAIVEAIRRQEVIRFIYKKDDTTDRRSEKLPLRMIEYKGRLYLIAWSIKRGRYEPYRLDGITTVISTGKRMEHRFDFDDFMATRFGLWEGPVIDAVLEISDPPTAANFNERRWHPTQQIQDLDGGAIRLSMRCGMSLELISMILHWTPKIRVIAPSELRKAVIDKHREYLAME